MNTSVSPKNDRLLFWLAGTLLLICFGLGDTAVIVWSASIATFGQLALLILAFLVTATGGLFTVWQMRRSKR